MLPVLRTELPPVLTIEAEIWLSLVMIHEPAMGLSNQPFLTMLVAVAVAVVEVVVVVSVVDKVTVLVTRVVSVTDMTDVVVSEAVSTCVEVLDNVSVTVTVVLGAETVTVSGKYPRHEQAEAYLA
jgi:hypothetical protein